VERCSALELVAQSKAGSSVRLGAFRPRRLYESQARHHGLARSDARI